MEDEIFLYIWLPEHDFWSSFSVITYIHVTCTKKISIEITHHWVPQKIVIHLLVSDPIDLLPVFFAQQRDLVLEIALSFAGHETWTWKQAQTLPQTNREPIANFADTQMKNLAMARINKLCRPAQRQIIRARSRKRSNNGHESCGSSHETQDEWISHSLRKVQREELKTNLRACDIYTYEYTQQQVLRWITWMRRESCKPAPDAPFISYLSSFRSGPVLTFSVSREIASS